VEKGRDYYKNTTVDWDNIKESTGASFGSSRINSQISGQQHSIWYNKKFIIEQTVEYEKRLSKYNRDDADKHRFHR
jgi:hypothetical protein